MAFGEGGFALLVYWDLIVDDELLPLAVLCEVEGVHSMLTRLL